MENNITVTLTQEAFKPEALNLADSGYFLDVLALSAKQWTQNEVEEGNYDYISDGMQYALNDFNYEEAFLQALNNDKEKLKLSPCQCSNALRSPLLLGAWCAIEEPEKFADHLKLYEEKLREQAAECIGDYNTDNAELNAELYKQYESIRTEQYSEWLNGDYRSWNGILYEAAKYHGFETVEYEEWKEDKPAALKITVSREWCEENMTGDDNTVFIPDAVALEIAAVIAYSAKRYVDARDTENAKRREEHERVRAYKAKQVEERERARLDRLNAMKR